MKRILSLLLMLSLTTTVRSQFLWRGAKTLNKGSVILKSSNYTTPFNRSWDWNEEEWKSWDSGKSLNVSGLNTMVGVGLTDRIEVMAHLPIAFKKAEFNGSDFSSSGLADIFFKTRIALKPWKKDQPGITAVAALRLGTAEETNPSLGDRTTDIILGGMFSGCWRSGWRAHAKAYYSFNGTTEEDINAGDEYKLVAKLDRKFSPRAIGFLSYIHYSLLQKKDIDGNSIDNTEKSRHYLCTGIVLKPVKGLVVRPKFTLPLAGRGRSLFTVQPLIDLCYNFQLF